VTLRTEPSANYIMPGDQSYFRLKRGCRYDFRYTWEAGRRRGHENQTRYVKSATLVDCPPT
jgi:hypothetical protein